MNGYAKKVSDKLWNIFFFIWKIFLYAVVAIMMFRILQADWLVFMLICIIIIILLPKSFTD